MNLRDISLASDMPDTACHVYFLELLIRFGNSPLLGIGTPPLCQWPEQKTSTHQRR